MTSEDVARILFAQTWTFAKSMPTIPHEYTLRRKWKSDEEFATVVEFIREHGYDKHFGRKVFRYFDVGDYCFWTMGSPIEQTILINRALRP